MKVVFDIETLPTENQLIREQIIESIKPPANISRTDSLRQWYDEKRPQLIEDAIRKTALEGDKGRVACIVAHAADGSSFIGGLRDGEAVILMAFNAYLNSLRDGQNRLTLVGHNCQQFDIPFLWQRHLVHAIPCDYVFGSHNIIADTMRLWTQDRRKHVSLDDVCLALNIEGECVYAGEDIYELYVRNRWDVIVEKCQDDVKRTRTVFDRMTASCATVMEH